MAIKICVLTLAALIISFVSVESFVPGQQKVTTTPPSCNENRLKNGKGESFTPTNCSSTFKRVCERLQGAREVYLPNCFGQASEKDAEDTIAAFIKANTLVNDYINNTDDNLSPRNKRCLDLLLPFMCMAIYPLSLNEERYFPCHSYCLQVEEACSSIDSVYSSLDICNKVWNNNYCPKTTVGPACSEPPNCYEECKKELPTCSKSARSEECRKNSIRERISRKGLASTANSFSFAAKVNITEEVYLCKPIEAIAYKAVIQEDYFLDCQNCSEDTQKLTGDTVYILTDDKVSDCSKQCVRQQIETDTEYLVAGHILDGYQSQCGHKIWQLKALSKTSLLYHWDKVVSDGKDSKIKKWVNSSFKCDASCKRKL